MKNTAIKNKLIEIGVDYAQGYGIEKPKPLAEILSSAMDKNIIRGVFDNK